jgi:hypothetical protein
MVLYLISLTVNLIFTDSYSVTETIPITLVRAN